MTSSSGLRVISIGLDPTIALEDPSQGNRGDSLRRQQEYAALAGRYTAIVKTPSSPRYAARAWGGGHTILPSLSRAAWTFPGDAYRLAAGVARSSGADLVVTQDPFATGLAGYWLKKRMGIPLCVQVHNDMIGCRWWMRESPVNRVMEPLGAWLIRQADTVQVVSNTIRKRLADRGMQPRRAWNIMTGAGIDAGQFGAAGGMAVRGRFLGERNRKLVLFMGRLVKQKDLPTLIQAAALVSREMHEVLFLVVGEGEEKDRLRQAAVSLGLESTVLFPGGAGPEEAPSFFAACDLFVMSSLYEGKARALVEAACAARPIVATAVSGADEVVEDGKSGFLVPLRDPGALARRMLRLLRDPALATEMGRLGHEIASVRYDRGHNLEQMVRMWEATARR